jgi:hypothetical protein
MGADYQPRVIIAPAEPGTVRRVGCIEIPGTLRERTRPESEYTAPLDIRVEPLRHRPDGRMLCWTGDASKPGLGCNGCIRSGARGGSKFCRSAYARAYAPESADAVRRDRSQEWRRLTPEQRRKKHERRMELKRQRQLEKRAHQSRDGSLSECV